MSAPAISGVEKHCDRPNWAHFLKAISFLACRFLSHLRFPLLMLLVFFPARVVCDINSQPYICGIIKNVRVSPHVVVKRKINYEVEFNHSHFRINCIQRLRWSIFVLLLFWLLFIFSLCLRHEKSFGIKPRTMKRVSCQIIFSFIAFHQFIIDTWAIMKTVVNVHLRCRSYQNWEIIMSRRGNCIAKLSIIALNKRWVLQCKRDINSNAE